MTPRPMDSFRGLLLVVQVFCVVFGLRAAGLDPQASLALGVASGVAVANVMP